MLAIATVGNLHNQNYDISAMLILIDFLKNIIQILRINVTYDILSLLMF